MQPNVNHGLRHCAECHDPIPSKRLNAVPDALFCVTCQAWQDMPMNLYSGMSRLEGVLAIGAAFHLDDVNELTRGRV